MSVQPTRDVDHREAEIILRLWLKEQGLSCGYCKEWTKWYYGDIPFWSTWTEVISKKFIYSFCGIHIYDDGRVLIVANDQQTLGDVRSE